MTNALTVHDPMIPVAHRVIGRTSETGDTVTIELQVPTTPPVHFTPGQFNMLAPFGIGEAAISISGDPMSAEHLIHTVRSVGAVSAALTKLQIGDEVGVRGPFGTGWPMEKARGRDVVIVAGGIGLAPLRPAILQLLGDRDAYEGFWLVYGARSPSDLLYTNELHSWRARFDAHVEITVDRADDSWHGDVGVVTRFLPLIAEEANDPIVMLCGPEIMMQVVAERLVQDGVASSDVFLSLERNMKCGIGHCGHCQFGPDFVCQQGPVLRYDVLEDRLRVREL